MALCGAANGVGFVDAEEVGDEEYEADGFGVVDVGHAGQLDGLGEGAEDEEDDADGGGERGGAGDRVIGACGYALGAE